VGRLGLTTDAVNNLGAFRRLRGTPSRRAASA
jgi:hypothetical protein